jgi:hypothetical protein
MGPLAGMGLAVQGLSSLFGAIQGSKMLKEAKKITPQYKPYETSKAASEMLGLAQTRLNAINPMRAAAQRNIGTSQANTMAGISRNVTDPSQALAMAAGVQGQADQALFNIGAQDQAMQQQNLANLMQAQNVMIGEDRMKYQDMLTKFQLDQAQKNALRSAGQQNILGAGQNLSASLFGAQQMMNQAAGALTGGAGGAAAGFGSAMGGMMSGGARSASSGFGYGIGGIMPGMPSQSQLMNTGMRPNVSPTPTRIGG